MSHRNSHYWLWFLVFGVIPLIGAAIHHFPADTATYTAYWFLGTGVLGLLLSNKGIDGGKLARPFDILVGLIFTIAGIVGILGYLSISTSPVSSYVTDIGLDLNNLYPLVYAFLGLKSLHHGLDK